MYYFYKWWKQVSHSKNFNKQLFPFHFSVFMVQCRLWYVIDYSIFVPDTSLAHIVFSGQFAYKEIQALVAPIPVWVLHQLPPLIGKQA